MRYRRDIDGLRAIAVLPVVFFHAGVPGFSGGFVGVDVFFVISGYLITSLIVEDLRGGHFSILDFYERRVRRILPALLVVLMASSVLAAWLLMPHPFREFSSSVVATLSFASNVLFWRRTGYFADPALEQPLLHTWSLAVEEQFYVVFPLLLLVVHRWFGGRWIAVVAPLAVLSFALSLWGVARAPSAAFYLAPFRAWELLLGSLVALGAFRRLSGGWNAEMLAAAGLGAIAWSVFALTPASPFPGANALLPCVGAALLLHSGGNGGTRVHRLLATGPLVFVGLISYSLYLWHWPLLVFAPIWNVYELTAAGTTVVVALSFVAATLSWRFVEAPFRRKDGLFGGRGRLFASVATASVALVAFGLFGRISDGWPARIPDRVVELAGYATSENPRQRECFDQPGSPVRVDRSCNFGAAVTPSVAVWGDSHADAMITAIGAVAARHDASALFFGSTGCPPIVGVEPGFRQGACLARNAEVLERILRDPNLETVILIARYALYIDGHSRTYGPAEADDPTDYLLTDASGAHLAPPARQALFERQLRATVDSLERARKRVVVVYPVPEVGYSVPTTLAALAMKGVSPASFTRPFALYEARQRYIFGVLDGLNARSGIVRLYPHRRLCDGEVCAVYAEGAPLYCDDDHLDLEGASFIADMFDVAFAGSELRTELRAR